LLDSRIHWEAHLMVKNPQDFLDYKKVGFSTVLLQYESFDSEKDLHAALKNLVECNLIPAISINSETPVSVLTQFESGVHHFQLMGIHPGFQGTPFLEETFDRLAQLRKLCPNAILEIDGAVNETNIKKLADRGADLLIAGSALTKNGNEKENFEKLSKIIQ